MPTPAALPLPDVRLMSHDSTPSCPLCEGSARIYLFSRHGVRVVRCEHCGLTRLDGNAVAEVPDPVRSADS